MTIYGFDWDGTLVKNFRSTPLPGARKAIRPYRSGVQTFIASNQAGPVFRTVTGSTRYPTVEQVCAHINAGLAALSFRPDLFVLCCHSGKDGAEWAEAAREVAEQFHRQLSGALKAIDYAVFLGPTFRKPQPGMLHYAAGVFKVSAAEIVYSGDMESDQIAARQAGCRYIDAADWLSGAALG
jgi:histidinol phosphatase-like enzyme